jgi:serine protease Do
MGWWRGICWAMAFALCATTAVAQPRRTPPPRAAEADMGAMLRSAQQYTVKVRASIAWPLGGDRFGTGQGTGFVIDRKRGWILTNAHVAQSSPGFVDIALGEAETEWLPVERVYVDNHLDIAVLKIAPEKLPATMGEPRLGCAQPVRQGAAVVAYGHPRDLSFTATRGIVSSVRTLGYQEYVQMDASLNPGNSGGPLLAIDASEVIGVSTAASGMGLNFATPMRHVCPILAMLKRGEDPSVPTLPIYWLKSGNVESLTVARTFPNAPADYPLKGGDEVLGIVGGPKFAGLPDLFTSLRGRKNAVRLSVRRDGALIEVEAPLTPAQSPLKREALAFSGMLVAEREVSDAEASALPRLQIEYIRTGEPAERAGFRYGDQIEDISGQRFESVRALHAYMRDQPGDAIVKVLVRRRTGLSARRTGAEYLRLDLPVQGLNLFEARS